MGLYMPSTVSYLFNEARVKIIGRTKWGYNIVQDESKYPGIYIVCLTDDERKSNNLLENAPISEIKIKYWIKKVPTIELDKKPNPSVDAIIRRLSEFWLPDENILYIGMTTKKINQRINQYYTTELGDKRPHAGGHWIKTLTSLNNLYIYYGKCNNPEEVEDFMLELFIKNVSNYSLSKLRDPHRPFPFANLEYPKGNKKNHDIGKSKL